MPGRASLFTAFDRTVDVVINARATPPTSNA